MRKQLRQKIADPQGDAPAEPPAIIADLAKAVRDRIAEYQQMLGRGEKIIVPAAHKLSDALLEQFVAHVGDKKSGLTQDIRMRQIAELLVPELDTLSDGIVFLFKLRTEILQLFVDIIMAEYMNDSLMINVETLVRDVSGIVQYRRGIHQMTAGSVDAAPPASSASSASERCIVS